MTLDYDEIFEQLYNLKRIRMRQSIRLSTLRRDHGPVIYKHDADVLQIECTLCEGNFAGVKGSIAVVGVQAPIMLLWEKPLPKSIRTITHLNA